MIEWGGGVRDVIRLWGGKSRNIMKEALLKNMMRIWLSLPRRTTVKHGAEEKPGGREGGGGGQGRWSYRRYWVGNNRMIARRIGGGGLWHVHPNLRQVLILIHKSMPNSPPSRSVCPSSVLCFAVPWGWKWLFPYIQWAIEWGGEDDVYPDSWQVLEFINLCGNLKTCYREKLPYVVTE